MVNFNNFLVSAITFLSISVFADTPVLDEKVNVQAEGHNSHNNSHKDDNKGDHKGGHNGGHNGGHGGSSGNHGKSGNHNVKRHRFKSQMIRHVDGHHGDFWRCPGPKVHCHNKHGRDIWNDHIKRCWIIDESGNGYCYAWSTDGCHIYKKYKIDDC